MVGVLASTRATDLDAVVEAQKKGFFAAEISLLISDRKDAYCLERAGNHGIEAVFINPRGFSTREEFDKAVAMELDKKNVEFVVCIGYMRLLSAWFVEKYRGRILNVHPSLLPSFPGMDLDVHRAVIDSGARVTGCTVHLVDEGKDTGPIVLQQAVEVKQDDTPETLKQRVQAAEQEVLPKAIRLLVEGKIKVVGKKAVIQEN